jgi:inorganic pyrophosphatase
VIEARPLGVFHLIDRGQTDDKILAVPATDPSFDHYKTLDNVAPHFLDEVQHFFSVYKDLEKAQVHEKGWEGISRAHEEIERGIESYVKMLRSSR